MLAGIHVQVTISDSSLSCRQDKGDSSIPNSSYCPDMKGVGNDFDIDLNPEHGFEIFTW